MKISFNKPYITEKEIYYIKDAVFNRTIRGDGHYSRKVARFFERKFGTKLALFVNSGTAALEMASLLLNLGPKDEVIMPSFTFVSTANAVLLRGAKPRFVDIEKRTLNIDPEEIMKNITSNTKAIYVVHYAGISPDMDIIQEIAEKKDLFIVEDAAQAVNAKYKNRFLGTIGDIGCYSFHESKNYVCGEGGAILINNEEFIERSEIIWEKGTNRRKFFKGEIDKYTWVDVGSSFLGSDLNAAFLYAQLEKMNEILQMRKIIYEYYDQRFKEYEGEEIFRIPIIPEYSKLNYHMYYLILKNHKLRESMMKYLNSKEIGATFHYIPLHKSPMGIRLGNENNDLPITEEYSSRLLRFPMFPEMKKEMIDFILFNIDKFLSKK
jgi:dTDP-4-amino-4,6-dideoxygalactose transaminase